MNKVVSVFRCSKNLEQDKYTHFLVYFKGQSGGHVKKDFLRRSGIIWKCAVGTKLPVESSHVARVGFHIHLVGGKKGIMGSH